MGLFCFLISMAFDTVEHKFILHALKYFGFGLKFVKLIEMLYKDINSSVSLWDF